MILAALEFLLLALDFFIFLLEPLIVKLASVLNMNMTRSIDKCESQHRNLQISCLTKSKISLACLGQDIQKLHRIRLIMLADTNKLRLSILRQVKNSIESNLKWISSLHLNSVDSVDRNLNWSDYDICIVAESEYLSDLMPKSEAIPILNSSFELRPIKVRGSSESVHSWQPKRVLLFQVVSAPKQSTATSLGQVTGQLEDCEQGKRDKRESGLDDDSPTVRMESDHQADLILSARLSTQAEFEWYQARSSLVFYYTQIHPELASLYLCLSKMLELAGLIELSANELAERAASAIQVYGSSDRPDYVHVNEAHLLSRYGLVLMLVAFLQQESSSKLRKELEKDEKKLLGSLLKAFLHFYSLPSRRSDSSLLVVQAKTIQSGLFGELEVVKEELDSTLASEEAQHLVIKEPLLQFSGLHRLVKRVSSIGGATELAKRSKELSVCGARISSLFRDLHSSLESLLTCGSECDFNGSLLESLFALCRAQTAPQTGIIDINANEAVSGASGANHKRSPAAPPQELIGLMGRKSRFTRELQGESRTRFGLSLGCKRQPGSLYQASRLANFSRGKILTNLCFLLLFLLIREQLLTRLERFRDNLHEHTRQDWINLKYTLMQGQPDGHDTSDFMSRQSYSSSFFQNVDAAQQKQTKEKIAAEQDEQTTSEQTRPGEDEIWEESKGSDSASADHSKQGNQLVDGAEDEAGEGSKLKGMDSAEFLRELMSSMMGHEFGGLDMKALLAGGSFNESSFLSSLGIDGAFMEDDEDDDDDDDDDDDGDNAAARAGAAPDGIRPKSEGGEKASSQEESVKKVSDEEDLVAVRDVLKSFANEMDQDGSENEDQSESRTPSLVNIDSDQAKQTTATDDRDEL